MSRTIGYARVSTTDQSLDVQIAALTAAGVHPDLIFAEKMTGTHAERPELRRALALLQSGDVLIVTRVDRLARSLRDLQNLVHDLKTRGVHLKATEQPIDTSTPAGKAFLDMLGVFAEFETNIRKERQAEGIAAAKVKGVYKGRPVSIDGNAIREALATGVAPTAVAERFGIARSSVYRMRDEAKA